MATPNTAVLAAFLLLTMSFPQVYADDYPDPDASLRFEYQYIRTGDFFDNSPYFASGGDVGNTDSHALIISGDVALNNRWTLFASLPYIQKRHKGTAPHDFTEFNTFDPPDRRLVDDGSFHGGLQDLSLGIRFLAKDGPLRISPFVSYGVPTDDYPFYGKAIIGTNLRQIPVGVQLGYQPYFSDWYFSGNVAYVFSEKPIGVNVDHWLAFASAGYYFTPGLFGSVFVSHKDTPNGLKLPEDFTDDPNYGDLSFLDSKQWWQHDRVLAHSFTNLGVGIDYILNKRYQISGQVFTGIHAEQTNEVDYAFTIAVTRVFGNMP